MFTKNLVPHFFLKLIVSEIIKIHDKSLFKIEIYSNPIYSFINKQHSL
jgi:hypothetical protein